MTLEINIVQEEIALICAKTRNFEPPATDPEVRQHLISSSFGTQTLDISFQTLPAQANDIQFTHIDRTMQHLIGDMIIHELRVVSCELVFTFIVRVASCELRVASCELVFHHINSVYSFVPIFDSSQTFL